MPVGFKNGTDGSLNIAMNALESAASGHSFLGINNEGQVSIISTAGNLMVTSSFAVVNNLITIPFVLLNVKDNQKHN